MEKDKGPSDSIWHAKVLDIHSEVGQCVTASCCVLAGHTVRQKVEERPAEIMAGSRVSGKMSEVGDGVGALQSKYNRIPEHLRYVMPPMDHSCCLELSQARQALDLVLRYEDCLVGKDGKIGWTD